MEVICFLLYEIKFRLNTQQVLLFLKAALRMDKHTPKERRQDRVEEAIHEVNIIIHQERPNVRALGDKMTV